jgi:hypothetical protein
MSNIKTHCHLSSGANKIVADVTRPTLLKLREVLQGHFNCKENNKFLPTKRDFGKLAASSYEHCCLLIEQVLKQNSHSLSFISSNP